MLDTMRLNQYNNLYTFMMQLSVLSHIYYGDKTFAQTFIMKVLPLFKSNERAFNDFIFLKGLASAQESLSKGEQVSIENVRVMASLASKTTNEQWKWTVCMLICDFSYFFLSDFLSYFSFFFFMFGYEFILFYLLIVPLFNSFIFCPFYAFYVCISLNLMNLILTIIW